MSLVSTAVGFALGALVAVTSPSTAAMVGTDDAYTLELDAPVKLSPGDSGTVRVSVAPAGDWHVNLEFPTSVTLAAEGAIEVPKGKLSRADAARLDADGLVFEVPVVARAQGSGRITGTLRFAVCRDDACAPKSEKLAWDLDVRAPAKPKKASD
jgi:hypothetical protein